MSLRRVLAAVVAVVAASTLSGCGSAKPGVAVEVGDQTLSTSKVDEMSVAYCDGLAPQLKANGAVFPMSYVRAYVVRNLTLRAAAEQLADAYSVQLPASYGQAVRDLRDQVAASFPAERVDDVVEVESVGAYLQAVELEVGGILLADSGESGSDDAAKLARGKDALTAWMSEHPAEVNPRYGIKVSDNDLQAAPQFVDTSTSFALSDDAVKGDLAEPDQEYAATLPSAQRCG
jgi:hypothetical protein